MFLLTSFALSEEFQSIESENMRIAFIIDEKPTLNKKVHIEIHVQDSNNTMVSGLKARGVIIHMETHESTPFKTNQPLEEIHASNPHRTFFTLKEDTNSPGHYHTDYTFKEAGLHEIVFELQNDETTTFHPFKVKVAPEPNKITTTGIDNKLLTITAVLALTATIITIVRKIKNK
jgi:hypothetical protein